MSGANSEANESRETIVFERGQTMRWRSAADEKRTPAERGVPDLWTYTDTSLNHLSPSLMATSLKWDKRKELYELHLAPSNAQ